jgi:hypothetical protein
MKDLRSAMQVLSNTLLSYDSKNEEDMSELLRVVHEEVMEKMRALKDSHSSAASGLYSDHSS